MGMQQCPVCNKEFKRGDKMIVVSYPVVCRSDGGDYSFLDDFSKNEKIIHLSCVGDLSGLFHKKTASSVKYPLKMNELIRELHSVLIELQEKATISDVTIFCRKNPSIGSVDDLVKKWLQNRNRLV